MEKNLIIIIFSHTGYLSRYRICCQKRILEMNPEECSSFHFNLTVCISSPLTSSTPRSPIWGTLGSRWEKKNMKHQSHKKSSYIPGETLLQSPLCHKTQHQHQANERSNIQIKKINLTFLLLALCCIILHSYESWDWDDNSYHHLCSEKSVKQQLKNTKVRPYSEPVTYILILPHLNKFHSVHFGRCLKNRVAQKGLTERCLLPSLVEFRPTEFTLHQRSCFWNVTVQLVQWCHCKEEIHLKNHLL